MLAELALTDPPDTLWRVEWKEPALRFSHISPAEARLDGAGNRFDIPGAGVLYAASDPEGCFAETTAHYRPRASLIAKMAAAANDGEAPPAAGVLDVSWRSTRMIRSFRTIDSLPFVDIEAPETHTYLTRTAANLLRGLGTDNLDVSTVRGPSRLLTRGIAGWLYSATDENGDLRFGGIRYMSRLGNYECWAIFDGTQTVALDEEPITATNPHLITVANRYGITVQ